MVEEKQQAVWHRKTSVLVIAFLCVGPFALPLLWLNTRYRLQTKIIGTIAVIIITYYLVLFTIQSMKFISDYYKILSP